MKILGSDCASMLYARILVSGFVQFVAEFFLKRCRSASTLGSNFEKNIFVLGLGDILMFRKLGHACNFGYS